MLKINTFTKSLVTALLLSSSIILFWQESALFRQHHASVQFLNYSFLELSNEIALAYQETSTMIKVPITSGNNTPSMWGTISSQLYLNDYPQNPRVQSELRKILADKPSFQAALNRSSPYIYYIYNETQKHQMPAEIALIPIIESEYNPNDHNSIGATGLWQIMPGTARSLHVKIGDGYDGRRNIVDSTQAALAFYNDLGNQFHDNWYLAFAAYNCGPGCIAAAVKKFKTTNFFDLHLPQETSVYVPRLLAIAWLIKNAKAYGIDLPPVKNQPYFTEVEVKKSETLESYAKSTGVDLTTLKELNPNYRVQNANIVTETLLVPVNSHSI